MICVGILVADVVGKPIEGLPARGKLQLVQQMELHTGGCACNTGVALARLGIPTALIGMVGQDGFGDFIVQAMEQRGLDTRGITRSRDSNTSATMVLVHGDGERSFLHYLGANAGFGLEQIDFALVQQAKVAHVGGALLMPAFDGAPTAEFLRRARHAGVKTSLDTAWDSRGQWMELIGPCLPHVDYFIPSIEEARMLTGREQPVDIARALKDRGAGAVALKMGSDGCYVLADGFELRLPALPVVALDALGAGDAFAAGLLAGVVQGWDLEKTARLANAVGALSVTALGATTGIRSLQETVAFMQEHPNGR